MLTIHEKTENNSAADAEVNHFEKPLKSRNDIEGKQSLPLKNATVDCKPKKINIVATSDDPSGTLEDNSAPINSS